MQANAWNRLFKSTAVISMNRVGCDTNLRIFRAIEFDGGKPFEGQQRMQSLPSSMRFSPLESSVIRLSRLLKYYQYYLESSDTPRFISNVASVYSIPTLLCLAERSDLLHRRAACLALGFLGDRTCSDVLGQALSDNDRRVRLVADDALRAIWSRDGSPSQRHALEQIIRLNECQRFEAVVTLATELVEQAGGFAEAYNQRGIAHFHLRRIDDALKDCRQVISLNRFHYAAWIGLGHGLLESGDIHGALDSFRMSLRIYPDLEPVRLQIRQLERSLQ